MAPRNVFIMIIITCFSCNLYAFKLSKSNDNFKITNNSCYVNGSYDSPYLMRSQSIKIGGFKSDVLINLQRLKEFSSKDGDIVFPIIEWLYNFCAQKKEIGANTEMEEIPRYPLPFYKVLHADSVFTLNLIFPDVLKGRVVPELIEIIEIAKLNINHDEIPCAIEGSSINIYFGEQLVLYAQKFLRETLRYSDINNLKKYQCLPLIPKDRLIEYDKKRLSLKEIQKIINNSDTIATNTTTITSQ